VRNNSLAMLATVAGVGILAWAIGFFDPETCVPGIQQPGWTSCEAIAAQRQVGLYVLVAIVIGVGAVTLIGRIRRNRRGD
jgi:hypothetical protein